MSHPQAMAPQLNRIQQTVLSRAERHLLNWLCARLPRWVTPDMLTSLALVAAAVIFVAYAMSNANPAWLWLAVTGYFVHWFGDSLDGSLARFRRIERPRYGYFIDHSCDGLAILLILGGMGASPYVRVDIALFSLTSYLLLAVNTFLIAKVMGDFPLSHLGGGPTELRLVLVVLTITMFIAGPDANVLPGFSGFDLFVGGFSAILLAIFLTQTWRTGRLLSAQDSRRS
uniref:CDP-alcohol phosphatidyltransferase family protein n=1 Tax=Altererythrobacter segetis TaxID=1104773 RepID=UPI00140D79D0|nr:CDP-alcohol phosphatidyltransferase family protein [Altererythrobacter segetis]